MMASIRSRTSASRKRRQKSPSVVGSGMRRRQGVEIDLVVAEPLEVLEASAAGEDVQRDVQDVVGLEIGEVSLQEVEAVADGGDQAGAAGDQQQGADAAGGQAVGAPPQFVVDVGGGDHGRLALGLGSRGDAVEDLLPAPPQEPPVALPGLGALETDGLGRDNDHHSKPSERWGDADLSHPAFSRDLRGFSSFPRAESPVRP